MSYRCERKPNSSNMYLKLVNGSENNDDGFFKLNSILP